jgi:hypothetical protein
VTLENLGGGSTRILAAAVAAIRPRGDGFDQPIDAHVLREIDAFLPHLPPTLRALFPLGLRLLEWGPPLFARPRRFARMSRLAQPEAEAYLSGWLEAGGLRGTLLLGLRTLVFLAFYQHPDVLASLGVDWQGRARLLHDERARRFAAGARP